MAWRSHGSTNDELVDNLYANGLIKSPAVAAAMKKVDRAHYTPSAPYQDCPQGIGFRATISAPHMHAQACESLLPLLRPGARVLDVGSGSGYLTQVLAELVQPGGTVVGVEHILELVALAEGNTAKSVGGRAMLEDGKVRYVLADGRLGWAGPGGEDGWDVIHVGAAAKAWPEELVRQLRSPGRMFIPVEGEGGQWIWVADKDAAGQVTKKRLMGVRYVPLTDAPRDV